MIFVVARLGVVRYLPAGDTSEQANNGSALYREPHGNKGIVASKVADWNRNSTPGDNLSTISSYLQHVVGLWVPLMRLHQDPKAWATTWHLF